MNQSTSPRIAPKTRNFLRAIDVRGLGWAVGEFGIASYVGIAATYLLFYATQVLGLSPAWAGLALLIPRVWNTVVDPMVGWLSDHTRTRFGRRRPYLLAGAIVWGSCFALLFNFPTNQSELLTGLSFGVMFLVVNSGLSLYQVPYAAMLAEISREKNIRTKLAAYREMVSRIAILLVLATAPWLLAKASSQAAGFSKMGIGIGSAIIVSGILAFFASTEPATGAPARQSTNLRSDIAALRKNHPLAWISGSFLLINIGDAVFGGCLVYYLTQVLGKSAALIGVLYPISSVTGFIAAPFWWRAARRFGDVFVCRTSLAITAACCLLPLTWGVGHFWALYPFMAIYGLGNSGARILPNAMVPDTSDLDERRTGERREGTIFGLFVFVQQTGFAVGAFVLSMLLEAGTQYSVHGKPEPSSISILLSFTVATALLYGGALAATFPYKIPSANYDPG